MDFDQIIVPMEMPSDFLEFLADQPQHVVGTHSRTDPRRGYELGVDPTTLIEFVEWLRGRKRYDTAISMIRGVIPTMDDPSLAYEYLAAIVFEAGQESPAPVGPYELFEAFLAENPQHASGVEERTVGGQDLSIANRDTFGAYLTWLCHRGKHAEAIALVKASFTINNLPADGPEARKLVARLDADAAWYKSQGGQ